MLNLPASEGGSPPGRGDIATFELVLVYKNSYIGRLSSRTSLKIGSSSID